MLRLILGIAFVLFLVIGGSLLVPMIKPKLLEQSELVAWQSLVPDQDLDGTSVVADLDQKQLSLVGFMVPLDYSGGTATQFLLVPNAGQCVHVPAPPPNQTILVSAPDGVKIRNLYQPIKVGGGLSIRELQTAYASTSYSLLATQVEDYEVQP